MTQNNSKFFSILVVGNNHTDIIKKYDKANKSEQYIKFKYLDAEKYQKREITALERMITVFKDKKMDDYVNNWITSKLKHVKEISSFEYYKEITEGLYYDNNGNALTDENQDGKYDTCSIGKHFSVPFTLLDGSEKYSALKKDIDWGKMHQYNTEPYYSAWELCVEGREPDTKEEETIKQNMIDKNGYFGNFKNKEEYVAYSTSYWTWAYVDDNSWQDIDTECNGNSIKWISEYYNKYIKPLPDDTLLTIYECTVRQN